MTKLGLHLAGPGFPAPIGRRRTFIEWILHVGFRATCLCISLCVLAFILPLAIVALGVVVGFLRVLIGAG